MQARNFQEKSKLPESALRTHRHFSTVRVIAVIGLGIILPTAILIQAFFGMAELARTVNSEWNRDSLVSTYASVVKSHPSSDHLMFFSLLYSENANQKTMINKQIMKVSIMQIGFAVMSIGTMFIVLGINDGGARGSAHFSGLKVDIRKASTGVMIFLVGAAMSTAGGILKNEYSTVTIPKYGLSENTKEILGKQRWENIFYQHCKEKPHDEAAQCFYKLYVQLQEEQK